MNLIKKIDLLLNRAERGLIILLLSVMIGFSFFQVVLRLCFSSGLLWADILLRHLVLWVGFLGAAVATSQGSHFAIDFLKKNLPKNLRKPVSILTDLLAVFVLASLSIGAWTYFKDELEAKSVLFSVGGFDVPTSALTVIIPAGTLLLAIHFLLRALSGSPEQEENQGL